MEHILNIAFNFDDERVRKSVEDQACNLIVNKMCKDMKSALEAKVRGWGFNSSEVSEGILMFVDKYVGNVIDENKDVIIERASTILADRLLRTKAAKAAVAKVLEDTQ